ncbi:MAG: hypothetical protein LBT55_07430 [Clostridiaceae bacterium]|nr:hypothetical protein [Clostridiaceae bacterium]
MKMEILKQRVRCDVAMCKNRAEYAVTNGGIRGSGIHLCGSCLLDIYCEATQLLSPKAPENSQEKSGEEKRSGAGALTDGGNKTGAETDAYKAVENKSGGNKTGANALTNSENRAGADALTGGKKSADEKNGKKFNGDKHD